VCLASLSIASICFFFFYYFCAPRVLHSFPTRRSSDLGGMPGPSSCTSIRTRPCSSVRRTSTRPRSSAYLSAFSTRFTSTCRSRRSEEHTSELQSRGHLVCRLLLEKKNKRNTQQGSLLR